MYGELRDALELSLKASPVLSTPDVHTARIEANDEFLVVCSDGFLDVFTPQQIIDVVRNTLVEVRDS